METEDASAPSADGGGGDGEGGRQGGADDERRPMCDEEEPPSPSSPLRAVASSGDGGSCSPLAGRSREAGHAASGGGSGRGAGQEEASCSPDQQMPFVQLPSAVPPLDEVEEDVPRPLEQHTAHSSPAASAALSGVVGQPAAPHAASLGRRSGQPAPPVRSSDFCPPSPMKAPPSLATELCITSADASQVNSPNDAGYAVKVSPAPPPAASFSGQLSIQLTAHLHSSESEQQEPSTSPTAAGSMSPPEARRRIKRTPTAKAARLNRLVQAMEESSEMSPQSPASPSASSRSPGRDPKDTPTTAPTTATASPSMPGEGPGRPGAALLDERASSESSPRSGGGEPSSPGPSGGSPTAIPPRCISKQSSRSARSVTSSFPAAFGQPAIRTDNSVVDSLKAIEDEFRFVERLGEGSFGLVQKAIRNSDGKVVAVKSIYLDRLIEYGKENLENELSIARQLEHPNIAMLYAVHYGDSQMHLVMELCSAGDLLYLIEKGTFFSEQRIARHLWEMVAGIAYCHHNRICHRDLKPENYLLSGPKRDAPLKLIDFGLASVFKKNVPMCSIVGTLQYCAPEMLGKGSYTEKCDIWSLGVVAFVLCTRRTPFEREDERAVIQDVAAGRGDWQWLDCRLVGSNPLKRVILSMLTLDPGARPAAKSFIEDEWFRERGTQRPRSCCRRIFG